MIRINQRSVTLHSATLRILKPETRKKALRSCKPQASTFAFLTTLGFDLFNHILAKLKSKSAELKTLACEFRWLFVGSQDGGSASRPIELNGRGFGA